MRVLIVVHGFPPASQGGSEIYAELQAWTLSQQYGDDVLVLTREHDSTKPEYSLRPETRRPLSIVWVNNTFKATRSFADTYENPALGERAAQVIDEFAPDVAHIHHLTCLSTRIVDALVQRRVPCFFTLHDFWLLCHRGQLLDRNLEPCRGPEPSGCDVCLDDAAGVGTLGYAAAEVVRAAERRLPTGAGELLRKTTRRAVQLTARQPGATNEASRRLQHMRNVSSKVTQFLAPSDHFRSRFIEFGIAPDRIIRAPYGFDHRPFRDLRRTASDRLRIGFLGSLMVSKAPHVLLEAYRSLPAGSASVDLFGRHVDYHGDASYRRRLEPLLAQDGVRIHGPIPHREVPQALAGIDVLVVPSIWPENSPLVIQEAFLAGAPVVASRIGGIPEVVSDEKNGLLFTPGDADDLHRALTRLLLEPDLMQSLRRGLPPASRSIEEDVAFTRSLYAASQSEPGPPRVAAVVLAFGSPDQTVLTVRSLLPSAKPFDEVIVVDNDPLNRCREHLTPVRDRITYLSSDTNLGFSGGMNLGIEHALARGATRILLVNNDVFVPPDCLNKLEDALSADAVNGIAGPVIRVRSDPDQVASLGMSYVSTTGRMRHMRHGSTAAPLSDTMVDAVSGCVMLVERRVLQKVGLLDNEYFFGFEDLDLCLRARRAGFRTVMASSATAYHEGSLAIGPTSTDRLYYAARNHLRAASRADPAGPVRALARGISVVALNLAHAVRAQGNSLPGRLLAVAQGTRDYVTGRFGPRRPSARRPPPQERHSGPFGE